MSGDRMTGGFMGKHGDRLEVGAAEKLFMDESYKRVAADQCDDGTYISTVFLLTPYREGGSPEFETMVFLGDSDEIGESDRAYSLEGAIAMHERIAKPYRVRSEARGGFRAAGVATPLIEGAL